MRKDWVLEQRDSDILDSVDKALTALEKRPGTPVRARIRGLDIELRMMDKPSMNARLGDLLASFGPWTGESSEELTEFLAHRGIGYRD
jgi:hypothetical protein